MSREGVVPLLKPPGLSSSDCVVDVRRLCGEKRVGHLGTLDPGAAGILPVCVGCWRGGWRWMRGMLRGGRR